MTADEMKELIAAGEWGALESAWVQAVDEGLPAPEMAGVLAVLAEAGQLDTAETLGWMLLGDRSEKLPPQDALDVAREVVSAVPDSDELRTEACLLYRKVHGDHEHFESLLEASHLADQQTPRRALRTLDVCLALADGGYLFHRFEDQVLRVRRYDPDRGQYELSDAAGNTLHMEPRALADDFDPVAESDFRVLRRYRPEELTRMLESDPAAVLIGLCQAHGGRVASTVLKGELTGRHMPAERWSRWWTKARAAAKRCSRLSLEGRNPTEVVYYPRGRRLEEELAPAAEGADMPLDRLAVLQQYARELRQRKLPVDPAFAAPLVEALAGQARSFRDRRPGDALSASLAVRAAVDLGLPPPAEPYPSPDDIVSSTPQAAQAVAGVGNPALWPAALDALARRADADRQLEALLHLAPAGQADTVVARLNAIGATDAVAQAAGRALADPIAHRELFLWLCQHPAAGPPNVPGKVELLSRMLDLVQRLDHDVQIDPADRREFLHRIRGALSARDYANYRQALTEMDKAVAETFKGRIQRSTGLAETVHDEMLNILREHFGELFLRVRVEPWLDESTVWTTEAALRRREQALKEIEEVKMLAVEKAIGEAAAHGDLRENSEYKSACEERDFLRNRAANLRGDLSKARVLFPEEVPTEAVGIGTRVALRRVSDGQDREMTILGAWDTDLERNVYSYQTALASRLLGKRPGDIVLLKDDQTETEYRIEHLASAME